MQRYDKKKVKGKSKDIKYKNKPVTVDNIRFDSVREANRYKELCLLLKDGRIKNLRLQVPFELVPAQYESYERYSDITGKRLKDGQRCLEKKVEYRADFVYQDAETGEWIVEDVKSSATKTEKYVIKRKLMLFVHGIRIHEV